jgi:hypothetical protein
MDAERQHLIDDFGTMLEGMGGGRMVGRVLGLLTVSDPAALSAEDISTQLRASRGAISQATRLLVQIGMIRRVSKPGERRDYFQVRPDAWNESTRRRLTEFDRLIGLYEQGLRLARTGDLPPPRNLEESLAFMRFWKCKFAEIFPAWEVERERLFGDSSNRDP